MLAVVVVLLHADDGAHGAAIANGRAAVGGGCWVLVGGVDCDGSDGSYIEGIRPHSPEVKRMLVISDQAIYGPFRATAGAAGGQAPATRSGTRSMGCSQSSDEVRKHSGTTECRSRQNFVAVLHCLGVPCDDD